MEATGILNQAFNRAIYSDAVRGCDKLWAILCMRSIRLCAPTPEARRQLAAYWDRQAAEHPEIAASCRQESEVCRREALAMTEKGKSEEIT